jgi:hypothetical protein
MNGLREGDQVVHPLFGLGTVLADEAKGRVEVAFDGTDEQKLLVLKYALLRRVDVDEERAIASQRAASFAESFSFEHDDEHASGSHWPPFYEDFKESVIGRLPELLAQADVAMGVSSFDRYRAPPLPASWPKGFKLRWPQQADSLHVLLRQTDSANMVTNLFPVIGRGTQETLVIDKVHVWTSGIEAQVAARLGDACITFFDTDFVFSTGWYRAGAKAEFILSGLAYQCEPANEPDIVMDGHSPMLAHFRAAARLSGDDPGAEPGTLGMKGAAILLPIDGWDRDDYQFRGTIGAVRPYPMLDVEGWLLTVCVLRSLDGSDREFNLNILVTRRVWQEQSPPEVGQDVRGALWLQGRLWLPPTALP